MIALIVMPWLVVKCFCLLFSVNGGVCETGKRAKAAKTGGKVGRPLGHALGQLPRSARKDGSGFYFDSCSISHALCPQERYRGMFRSPAARMDKVIRWHCESKFLVVGFCEMMNRWIFCVDQLLISIGYVCRGR